MSIIQVHDITAGSHEDVDYQMDIVFRDGAYLAVGHVGGRTFNTAKHATYEQAERDGNETIAGLIMAVCYAP